MDGPVSSLPERRPDEALAPVPAPVPDPSPAPVADSDVDRRLAALETGMAELSRRLEGVGDSVETTVRRAVGGELRAVTADLRHTVSELGRLLVRDLGKLAQLLSEHRDTIVAELRPPAGSEASRETAAGIDPLTATPPRPTDGDALAGAEAGGEAGGDPDDVAGDQHRRGRLRRRSG